MNYAAIHDVRAKLEDVFNSLKVDNEQLRCVSAERVLIDEMVFPADTDIWVTLAHAGTTLLHELYDQFTALQDTWLVRVTTVNREFSLLDDIIQVILQYFEDDRTLGGLVERVWVENVAKEEIPEESKFHSAILYLNTLRV